MLSSVAAAAAAEAEAAVAALDGVFRLRLAPGDFPAADFSALAALVRGPGAAGGARCGREAEAVEAEADAEAALVLQLCCGLAGEGAVLRGETIFYSGKKLAS